MAKTVLVLGAGASLPYGYPLGGELRQKILHLPYQTVFGPIKVPKVLHAQVQAKMEKFRDAFLHSQMNSIDAFLGRRPEFQEIGKKCIAAVLLQCEDPSLLFTENREKDHWYKYLFNHIAKNDWDELSFSDISIVTFNYDRSLEYFLYIALQYAYGKSEDEARKKLSSLRIVHVYGALSDELPGTENFLPYDGTVSEGKVELAARNLVVVPEGRSDIPTLITARKWLSEARQIGFLGFGFDETNVARLAENEACTRTIPKEGGGTWTRRICGTRIGIFEGELSRALRALTGKAMPHLADFHDKNCTEMLRIEQLFR